MFWIFLTMYPNVIDSSFCSYALEEDRYHYIFIENFSALQETIFWRNYKNSAIVYNRNTYAACIRKCTIDKKILQTEVHKIHLGFSHVVKILKCVWLSAIYISPFLKPVWWNRLHSQVCQSCGIQHPNKIKLINWEIWTW